MMGRDPVAVLAGGIVLAVAGAIAVIVATGLLALPTTVRIGFAAVAAVVGLGVYLSTRTDTPAVSESPTLSPSRQVKLVAVGGALAVAATAVTGSRLLPLAVFLPVGYLLVADQILHDGPPIPSLLSASVLFAVPVYTKYLTTGFYFGGTDTFAHVDSLNRLIAAGHTFALPHGYDYFPGFHLVVGSMSIFADIEPYDAILLTGIAALTLTVPIAYLLGRSLFGEARLGVATALGVTTLEFVAYHALYFFPQALAVVVLGIGFYATVRLATSSTRRGIRRFSAYLAVLVVVLVSIHHLTYVLLLGAVLAVGVVSVVGRPLARRLDREALEPFVERAAVPSYRLAFPIVFGTLFFLAYLVYSPSIILFGIGGVIYALVTGLLPAVEGPSSFLYGVEPLVDTLGRGFEWLLTPTGIYYGVLGGVLLAGLYECLSAIRRYAGRLALLFVGFASVPLLLPLPVEVPQIERLVFVLTLFLIFPLGIGIARTLRASAEHRRVAVALLLVVATLGTTAAFTQLTADDIDGVYLDERGAQSSMSDREYAATADTARFLETHATGEAASDYVTRRAVESAVAPSPMNDALRVGPDGLSAPPGHLVVRDSWSEYTVQVTLSDGLLVEQLFWFSTSEERLDHALADRNVVYSTGETHVLYDDDGYEGLLGAGNS